MKKLLIIICLGITLGGFTQSNVPNAFKYQGIIRDGEGNPLINDAVTLKLSVRSGNEAGTIVYQETHNTATNAFGLVNVNMGEGNPVIGTFDAIAWGEAAHFLQVEVNNGGGFLNMGSYQLLSVPYAHHARVAESSGLPAGNLNNTLFNNGAGWTNSDFLSNDGSHVGIGIAIPASDLHINSDKYVPYDPDLDVDIPLKIICPSVGYGMLMDANEIQTVNDWLYINFENDQDISLGFGGGRVRIGEAIYSSPDALVFANTANRLSAIYATDSDPTSNCKVVHGEYTGAGTYDAVGVYGSSVPLDNYGYGGFFQGGYRGAKGICIGTGNYSYPGLLGESTNMNTGTNIGVEGIAVNGSYNQGIRGTAGGAVTNSVGVYGTANGSPANYGVYGYASTSGSNYAIYCYGDGAYTGTWTDVSDERFKENIQPFSGALEGINMLNVYNYSFRTDGEAALMNLDQGTQTGFISQELEGIFPELVRNDVNVVQQPHDPNSKEPMEFTTIHYKGINYIGMVPYLTQAIKEQQEIIEELKSELESLKEKISLLESRIE